MVVLLRHAHAIGKQSWRGSDAHRPLSALGQEQAAGLVDTLTGVELRVLYCSPTTRCLDTLAPLAAAYGLAIHEHPLLAPDAAADDLFAALDTVDLTGTLWGTALAACTRTDGTRAFPIGDTAKVGPGFSMPTPRRATSIPIRRSSRLRRWGSPLRKCNERLRAVDPGDPATLPSVTQVTLIRGSVGVTFPALPDTVRIAADAGPAAPE